MSDRPRAPATYDSHTTDHEEIRGWVTERGGQPVALQHPDAEEFGIAFDGLDRAIGSPGGQRPAAVGGRAPADTPLYRCVRGSEGLAGASLCARGRG